MNTDPHPRAQLSAYLDDALAPTERTAVGAHLDVCSECRARLAELRATAALIASLPDPVPTRRLVPRTARTPAWLAPLRTLTTLASGVSAFLFIASALLANIGGIAQGTAAVPAAAPQASAAAGGAATTSERNTTSAAPSAAAPAPNADSGKLATSATPPPGAAVPGSQFNTSTATPQDAVSRVDLSDAHRESERTAATGAPRLGPSPWLWLALALITGAIALALQKRLREAK